VNASANAISNLLKLLTFGQIASGNRDDLLGVENAASVLGIALTNLLIEKKSGMKKPPTTAVTAKMTFKPAVDETPVNIDTFAAREGEISQWSDNGSEDTEEKTEEGRELTSDKETISDEVLIDGVAFNEVSTVKPDGDNVGSNNKIYQCKHCPKKFAGQEYLEIHQANKHVNSSGTLNTVSRTKKNLNCSICDKSFPSKSSMKTHNNTHTKPNKCLKCDKGFSLPRNLKIHNGKCTATQNSISQVGQLDHCEFCKEQFDDPGELESHMVLMHSINEMIQTAEFVR